MSEPDAKRPRVEAVAASDQQASVADHYNKRGTVALQDRQFSPIIRLKSLNNWVKHVLIDLHVTQPNSVVLDLCGGKGGDLSKFKRFPLIKRVVLADHAELSVKEAMTRFAFLKPSFQCRFLFADCFRVPLSLSLPAGTNADLVSCQFALHYSFETEARARCCMRNIAQNLAVGGHFVSTFPDSRVLVERGLSVYEANLQRDAASASTARCKFGNGCYSVDFEKPPRKLTKDQPFGVKYVFSLQDAIDDCPEYLVHYPTLIKLAHEFGLEPLFNLNFHDFFYVYSEHPTYRELLYQIQVLGPVKGQADVPPLSADEWEAARVYSAVAFKKVREVVWPIDTEAVGRASEQVNWADLSQQRKMITIAAPE